MDKEIQISHLESFIKKCNEAYKNGNREVSDEQYDSALEELRLLDPENELCAKVQSDIGTVSMSKKFDFGDRPMLSLNKVYSVDDLIKWMKSVSRKDGELFYLEPKYDGLSGCADSSGIFSTRGDGQIGEVITSKTSMLFIDKWTVRDDGVFIGYPERFNFPKDGQIRGEIIFNRNNFYTFQKNVMKKDGTPYKNSRNCISGIMNPAMSESDSAQISENMDKFNAHASFVCHDEIKIPIEYKSGLESQIASQIEKTWENFRKNLPYDQDGLVCKLADSEYGDSLGNTGHHPRSGMALKKNNEGIPCRLLNITWFVGSQGELTPVYNIEPTEIDGVVVSNVLGHNMKNLEDNDVRIGDNVIVVRSGQVIPFACGYEKGENHDSVIFTKSIGLDNGICPCCSSPIIYDRNKSPDCYCSNENCHDRVMKRLYNAVSKCFEIKGLAEETLEKINEMYGITKFYQLFDLTVGKISALPGFADKSGEILYNAIQDARQTTDVKILASIGIQFIGRRVAKDVLSVMSLETLRNASVADLTSIPTFGQAKAQSLTEGLRKYKEELDEILLRVEVEQTFSQTKKSEASGKPTICFTGASPIPRSECQELARKNGYEPISGVNKNLNVLVCASTDTNSTKAQKARKYGTRIMSFEEWYASLENKDSSIPSNQSASNPLIDDILG